jgi:hypothetical protein
MEETDNSRSNKPLEGAEFRRENGETIATASKLQNYLISLHTEEATGSIQSFAQRTGVPPATYGES